VPPLLELECGCDTALCECAGNQNGELDFMRRDTLLVTIIEA